MTSLSSIAIAVLAASFTFTPLPARAQTVNPPQPTAGAISTTGSVSGKIIDQNKNMVVTESQDVMLHTWDQDNNSLDMLHAQSATDGTFLFPAVDLQPQYQYGVMAVFDGVTYLSEVGTPEKTSSQLVLDVPVFETTQDTSSLQVDQMHVLFKFAEDGLETTEILTISNTGLRTVKDAVKLEDGKTATLRYPLPANADYIFFQPDGGDRFVKFAGGFADTSPFLPGGQGDQYAVQYMVPYAKDQAFDYTAPVNLKAVSLLVPADSGITLKGNGLAGSESYTFGNGKSYDVYTFGGVPAGGSFHVAIAGKPKVTDAATKPQSSNLPLALGGGLLGGAMIAAAIWWWRRPGDGEAVPVGEGDDGETDLDNLVIRIAGLDAAFERGDYPESDYRPSRERLSADAKRLIEQEQEQDRPS